MGTRMRKTRTTKRTVDTRSTTSRSMASPSASLDEIQVCINVLGKKLLPNTLGLAQVRGGDPEQRWLRKMPDETKSWRFREKAVKYLEKALWDFGQQVEN